MRHYAPVLSLLALTLTTACGTAPGTGDSGDDGLIWGPAGTSNGTTDTGTASGTGDTADTNTGDTDTNSGTGTDTAVADLTVTAKVWIYPNAAYDISSPNYGTSTPQVCMFDVVVNGGFPDDYGTCVATGYNEYMADPSVTYIPGDDFVIQAGWDDFQNARYYGEKNGVVNAVELRVVVEFPDGAWQAYAIGGADPTEPGTAGWSANGDNTGGEVHVWTFEDSLDHRDQ